MFVYMDLRRAVSSVGEAADACAAAATDGVDVVTLREQLVAFRTNISRLEAQFARLSHAAERRGAHLGTSARDTAEYVGRETGTSTRKNRTAAELGAAMNQSEALADAVASGTVSSDKANAAVAATDGLPLDAAFVDELETLPLNGVKPAAERWQAAADADGEASRAQRQRARRFLRLSGAADGMTRVDGLLDPESAGIVRTTLDAVMAQSAFDNSERTRDQRCADALTQLAKAASKGAIAGGRSNAKILATVPFQTVVERAAARGVLHSGPTIDAATVRRLACDAGIHRVIVGPGSSVLDFGRENRLVSENLFLALVARDQHCRWPGCTVRATWCDAHHVTEWGEHGRTDEATCALLCHHHHTLAHETGWHVDGDGPAFVVTAPDGTRTESRPPPLVATPRADSIGREQGPCDAPSSFSADGRWSAPQEQAAATRAPETDQQLVLGE